MPAKAEPILKEEMEFVTIPEKDLFDQDMTSIWLNNMEFTPGTHMVSKDIANSLNERLRVFQAQQIRILQPGVDKRAIHDSSTRKQVRVGGSEVVA